jgi:hypothetical protein
MGMGPSYLMDFPLPVPACCRVRGNGNWEDAAKGCSGLQEGRPRSKALLRQNSVGRLKINISSGAAEAGRSRTLIALEDCKYPKVRQLILSAKDEPHSEIRTSGQLINKLREDIAGLGVDLKNAQAEALRHFQARQSDSMERCSRSRSQKTHGGGDKVVQFVQRS